MPKHKHPPAQLGGRSHFCNKMIWPFSKVNQIDFYTLKTLLSQIVISQLQKWCCKGYRKINEAFLLITAQTLKMTTKELSKGESYLIKEWNVCYL